MAMLIGIDIGGTKCAVVQADNHGYASAAENWQKPATSPSASPQPKPLWCRSTICLFTTPSVPRSSGGCLIRTAEEGGILKYCF